MGGREEASLRKALGWHRSQGKVERAGAATSPGDLPWEGGTSHQMGDCSGPLQEILPTGRLQPAPYPSGLTALALHRTSTGKCCCIPTIFPTLHTAASSTAASPGSPQDSFSGTTGLQNWHCVCKHSLSVSPKNLYADPADPFGLAMVEMQQVHAIRFCWWLRQTFPGIFR